MKVTRLGDGPFRFNSGFGYASLLPQTIGAAGTVVTSDGSNGAYWGENVARISANGSNAVQGPFVSIAAGSNIILAVSSNTLNIASTGGGAGSISAGSNSTHVREISTAGASTSLWSPFDHAHAGVSEITSSSSNTLQRGTVNLRPGSGIAYGLTDTDGDGEFDTLTISSTGAGGGGSGSGALVWLDRKTASTSAELNFDTVISSTYDVYVFEFINLRPATDNDNWFWRARTGGTPTTDTGSNYWSGMFRNSSTGTAVQGNTPGAPGTSINLTGNGGVDNGTGSTVTGRMILYNPMSTTAGTRRISSQLGYVDNAGGSLQTSGHGGHLGSSAITGCNFLFGSGNITSGYIDCYGLKHV